MSGVEAAGLLLAVIPLFMAAAENQRRLYGVVITVLKPRVKDEKLATQYQHIHNEVSLLSLTIRDFISSLPTLSASDKDRLLDLDEQLLQDDRIELALSQRLGSSSQAFIDTLKTILQCLDDLLSDRVLKLKKADIAETPRELYRKLDILRKRGGDAKDWKGRLRFTASDRKRRKALDKLTEKNKTLERFIRLPQAAAAGQESQPAQQDDWTPPPRYRPRKLVQNMYDAISRVWALNCSCPSPHEAMLSLYGSFMSLEGASECELDLLISTRDETIRKWQESRIRAELTTRRDSKVRFEDSTMRQSSAKRSTPTPTDRRHVESICVVLEKARHSNTALEVLYENGILWYKARKLTSAAMEPCTTLDHLLRHESKRKLKERRVLAVILAHSLLQLCDSNWMENELDKTQISFFSSAPDRQLNLKPYLVTRFQALADRGDDSGMRLHPSPTILALGILLLELEIWATIESRRMPADLTDDGSVNINTNLMTAERVFRDSDGEIFENYRKAIQSCLKCEFLDESSVGSNEEGFRSLVYENIVAPLERELYQGWGMRPQDLQSVFV